MTFIVHASSSFSLFFLGSQCLLPFCYLSVREENPSDFGDPFCPWHSGDLLLGDLWSLDPHGRAQAAALTLKLGKSRISTLLEEVISATCLGWEQGGGVGTEAAAPGVILEIWRTVWRINGRMCGNLNESQEGVLAREWKISSLTVSVISTKAHYVGLKNSGTERRLWG